MPFNPQQWVLSRTIMTSQGVATEDANRLSLLTGMVDVPLPQSMLLSIAVARANTADEVRAPIAAEPEPEPDVVFVPDVTGRSSREAARVVEAEGLVMAHRTVRNARGETIIEQEPAAGEIVPVGSQILVYVPAEQEAGECEEAADGGGDANTDGANDSGSSASREAEQA